MKRALLISGLVGFFGTVLVVVLGYTDYSLLRASLGDALAPVWQWPLFGMALVLTTLSILVPFAAHFFRRDEESTASVGLYAFGYLWLLLFVFHPGNQALGVTSDAAGMITWVGVCAVQYLAARILLKAINVTAASNAA